MSCSSCSTFKTGTPRGCGNNGSCGSGSCNKLTVFDWLENMQTPEGTKTVPFVEVRFKNSRKEYYRYPTNLILRAGNLVITALEKGYDLGIVSLSGPLVAVQMKRKKVKPTSERIGTILRLADQTEIDLWQANRAKEEQIQKRARELAIALKLNMKLSDVEFQADGKKATFYYTADHRVDFRQLIKDMAREFSIRIEMRQIGLRQEASRLGGIGSCGRELCCSTWLTDFRSVSTAAARYQRLSLNPQKLAGQCGRLKCCLNYELETYRTAVKAFPKTETKLYTEKGTGVFQKMDIFKGFLWYAYKDEWVNWYKLSITSANEIIALNRENKKARSLEAYAETPLSATEEALFETAVGLEDITRFDTKKKPNRKTKRRRLEKNNKK